MALCVFFFISWIYINIQHPERLIFFRTHDVFFFCLMDFSIILELESDVVPVRVPNIKLTVLEFAMHSRVTNDAKFICQVILYREGTRCILTCNLLLKPVRTHWHEANAQFLISTSKNIVVIHTSPRTVDEAAHTRICKYMYISYHSF